MLGMDWEPTVSCRQSSFLMAGTSFSSDTIDLFLFEEDELDEEEEEAVLRFRELFCFLPERDSLTFYLLICQLISTLAPLNS